jgi:hypothetical protein
MQRQADTTTIDQIQPGVAVPNAAWLNDALADAHQVDRHRLANELTAVLLGLRAEVQQNINGTVGHITMAKASQQEVDDLIDFLRTLEEKVEEWDESDLLDYLEHRGVPSWERTVFGFSVLVDNVCDPDVSYLDWKPELKRLLEQPYQGGDA